MTYQEQSGRRQWRTREGMPPSQDNKPTSLNEARNEMRRLMAILMKANKAYLLREQTVMELHRLGKQNFSGELVTVLNNDLLLTNLSGMSKTVSTLMTGVSAYIQAEIAMKGQPQEGMPCICGGDQAPWAGHSAACRNQRREHA